MSLSLERSSARRLVHFVGFAVRVWKCCTFCSLLLHGCNVYPMVGAKVLGIAVFVVRVNYSWPSCQHSAVYWICIIVRPSHLFVCTNAARDRILHRRLLVMHLMACVHMLAGTVEYVLPATDTTCGVTRRAYIYSLFLYDVSVDLKSATSLALYAPNSNSCKSALHRVRLAAKLVSDIDA